jgi:GNAT superfamily N-acetyltransferase
VTPQIRTERLDGSSGELLVARVQQEYVRRYGGPDATPMDPADFVPPRGVFLVAYVGDRPVGCGGVRAGADATGELKRMYVEPDVRGNGIARQLLAGLEAAARDLGARRLRLETGTEQPEAVALYTSSGYAPIPGFGIYADEPRNLCFGKLLDEGPA